MMPSAIAVLPNVSMGMWHSWYGLCAMQMQICAMLTHSCVWVGVMVVCKSTRRWGMVAAKVIFLKFSNFVVLKIRITATTHVLLVPEFEIQSGQVLPGIKPWSTPANLKTGCIQCGN